MASRSFKPASYLASQPTKRNPRPPCTRSSSASSTKSEDSLIAVLKSLSTTDIQSGKDRDSTGSLGSTTGGASPRCNTPVNTSSLPPLSIDDTPGRKRSQPIAIELPQRHQPVYTPLSARGDLPGGYFPNHEKLPKPFKSNPFSKHHQEQYSYDEQNSPSEPSSPLNMSNVSSAIASPTEAPRRAPPSILSNAFQHSIPVPEVLTMPTGKYHPANYKVKTAPISVPPLPATNLYLPPSVPDRKKSRPVHERHGSDIKRKLQEYQMAQSKQTQMLVSANGGAGGMKPISPRLLPLGSPGPITPFELEENAQVGYVVAGAKATTDGLFGNRLERERDQESVNRMIREEEGRRVFGGKNVSGTNSPILSI